VSTGSKDGAWLADAKLAGGVDSNGNEHPLNCDTTGTLEVTGVVITTPTGIQTVAIRQTSTDNDVNVTGTVSVSNFPASVEISNDVGNPIPVSGSLTTTPSGTQDVNILSSIALPVTDNGGSLTVDGTFFQATQPISGTVAVSNFPATQPVSGTVAVSNFPATQPISGSVSVSNFPASVEISNDVGNAVPVSGTFFQATQPVSGTFFQATQPVSGPLTDAQLRATPVPISGTISAGKSQYTRTDTYTVAANGVTLDATASCAQFFSVQVKSTGGIASAWDVRLEGSLDNVSFTQILQHTNVTGDGAIVFSGNLSSPSLYFRSRLASITLGLATNVVVVILGA
jgi:hypothetical protein